VTGRDVSSIHLLATPKRVIAALRTGGRGKMLLAVAFGWFLSISVRMIYPALLPEISETYDLTLTTAGLLITVLWIAYAFGQLPGVGRRRQATVPAHCQGGRAVAFHVGSHGLSQ